MPGFEQSMLLLLATGLWGVGFVAVSNTLQVMHPLWSNAWRFVLAAPLALLLFRTRLVWDRAHQGAAAVAGACLALAFLFQTFTRSVYHAFALYRALAHEEHPAAVTVKAILDDGDIEIDDVTAFQDPVARNAMANDMIDRCTD